VTFNLLVVVTAAILAAIAASMTTAWWIGLIIGVAFLAPYFFGYTDGLQARLTLGRLLDGRHER
jgi:hypothetical protein